MGERVIAMVSAPAGVVRTWLRDPAALGVTLPAADSRMRRVRRPSAIATLALGSRPPLRPVSASENHHRRDAA
jgi:hypothetical protein